MNKNPLVPDDIKDVIVTYCTETLLRSEYKLLRLAISDFFTFTTRKITDREFSEKSLKALAERLDVNISKRIKILADEELSTTSYRNWEELMQDTVVSHRVNSASIASAYLFNSNWITSAIKNIGKYEYRRGVSIVLMIGVFIFGLVGLTNPDVTTQWLATFFHASKLLLLFFSCFISLSFLRMLIIQYRVKKGYFGRSHYETKLLLDFITKNSEKDDFYDDNGKPKKTFEELQQQLNSNPNNLKDALTL